MRCFTLLFLALIMAANSGVGQANEAVQQRRVAYLEALLSILPQYRPPWAQPEKLSYQDEDWLAWLRRTGELPPDFENMPASALLPDPRVPFEKGSQQRIVNPEDWPTRRDEIAEIIKYWFTGSFPPPPENLRVGKSAERYENGVRIRKVQLNFGPESKAKLTLELYFPSGPGPFPVYMTPGGNAESWISISQAISRGYIACLYAACDAIDDTENYAPLWPEYDFTRLMRRAWGAHRAVDYLYTLPEVNRDQIALTGLSRDGKQVLMAAAFDERIDATVVCSGGTGGENPFRYTSDQFDNETIGEISEKFPNWLHPRMRFSMAESINYLSIRIISPLWLLPEPLCLVPRFLKARVIPGA